MTRIIYQNPEGQAASMLIPRHASLWKTLQNACHYFGLCHNDFTLAVMHGPLKGIEIDSDFEWEWEALHENAINTETGVAEFTLLRHAPASHSSISPKRIQIFFKTPTGKTITMDTNPHGSLEAFMERAANGMHIPLDHCRFLFAGRPLEPRGTPHSIGLHRESTVHVIIRVLGGKPIIYLFPPERLDLVNVTLTLASSWSFSAVYPLTEVSTAKVPSHGTTATWNVSASPDATLVDLATKTDLSYLFWEAESSGNPDRALTSAFDPNNVRIDTSNAIALPFDIFIPYLDRILVDLTLHTSARNDFITYWLPKFVHIQNGGKDIAFRFIPQAEFEQAAKLEVQPAPDVVTRVFLVFKGVEKGGKSWKKPEEMDWSEVIGIDQVTARDQKLFRVLEWGGMEIHD